MLELNPAVESRMCSVKESQMSAVRCMEGFRDKMEMLIKAGDIIDHTKGGRSTKEETREARARSLNIWKQGGYTMAEAARKGGADVGSFRKWLIENGHHTAKSR
jgi:endonuclease YncB( thermonuclease family)